MIYVMFSCDVHKNFSSMRMLGATTSLDKVKAELQRMLKADEVEFNRGDKFDARANWRVYDLNSEFDYVYIEEVNDGEFVQ